MCLSDGSYLYLLEFFCRFSITLYNYHSITLSHYPNLINFNVFQKLFC
jgi:hypothetical protein